MLHEETIGNYRIEILEDQYPDDPREWDNLSKMVCFHKNYSLGDKDHGLKSEDFDGWDDLKKYLVKEMGAINILPLYLYDHSGISMYIPGDGSYRQHEAWDSGQVGFVFTTKERIKEMGTPKNQIDEAIREEVKTYNKYLTGEVYNVSIYEVKTCNMGEDHQELIDGGGNIYDDLDDAIAQARSTVNSYLGIGGKQ